MTIRTLFFSLILFSFFLSSAAWVALGALNPAAGGSGCVSPIGAEGAILYNKDYHTPQYCDGDDWIRMIGEGCGISFGAPTDCPNIGDVCTDGSVFAGLDGADPLYATRCDAGMTWGGASCTGGRGTYPWNNGNNTGYVTTSATSSGESNTNILITTDSDSISAGTQPHQVAQYCADLIRNGRDDWYLPSKNELDILYGNEVAIANFETSGSYYWSSLENNSSSAWRQDFSDGNQLSSTKVILNAIRCVRR